MTWHTRIHKTTLCCAHTHTCAQSQRVADIMEGILAEIGIILIALRAHTHTHIHTCSSFLLRFTMATSSFQSLLLVDRFSQWKDYRYILETFSFDQHSHRFDSLQSLQDSSTTLSHMLCWHCVCQGASASHISAHTKYSFVYEEWIQITRHFVTPTKKPVINSSLSFH